jgi:hypothetical protein
MECTYEIKAMTTVGEVVKMIKKISILIEAILKLPTNRLFSSTPFYHEISFVLLAHQVFIFSSCKQKQKCIFYHQQMKICCKLMHEYQA